MNNFYVLVNKITGEIIETKSKIYFSLIGADDARNKYIADKYCDISPENIVIRKFESPVDLSNDDLNKLEEEKKEKSQSSFRQQLVQVTRNREISITFANTKLTFNDKGTLCKVILDNGYYKMLNCETNKILYVAPRMSLLKDILYEEFNKGVIERIELVPWW